MKQKKQKLSKSLQKQRNFMYYKELEMYPISVVIACGDVVTKLKKRYNYIPPSAENDAAYASETRLRNKETDECNILIHFRDIKAMTTTIIAHECAHAAIDIFDWINERVSFDCQEPFAYLSGYLAKLCIDCKENNIKSFKKL